MSVVTFDWMELQHTLEEIEKLIHEFAACSLRRRHWIHHAHFTVALLYLKRDPLPEATNLIRYCIQRYNECY